MGFHKTDYMNIYVQLGVLLIGTYVFCRSLSLMVTQWELLSYHDSAYIPRIVHQQKACDILMILYYTASTFIGLWLMVCAAYIVFMNEPTQTPSVVRFVVPIILWCLLIVYGLVRVIFNEEYDLPDFYKDMNHYRKAQEVITADNDQEVNFIRSYNRVCKMDKCALVWFFTILLVVVFI